MLRTKLPLLFCAVAAAACGSHENAPPVTTTAATTGFGPGAGLELREYTVPTAGAFPHDVAVGRDGALWFTEERGNKIGRLDPRRGAFREWPVPTRDAAPHGIAVDREGHVWFSANGKGFIGELDPASSQFATFAMPDPRASDPHTLVFAPDGTLWFTVEKGGFVGKLSPRTGQITLRPLARPGALPYGITIGKDGAAYVAEFGSNHIARVDAETMAVEELALAPDARPRRIAAASDGMLYFTDFARGKIGRVNPATATVDEWSAPDGARSAPYGLAVARDGDVWFVETGVQPSKLVRFDPRTQDLAARVIPSGGVVRNIAATRDGGLFFACSDRNEVALVTPGPGPTAMR